MKTMRTLIIVVLALFGFSTVAVAQGTIVGVAESLQADQIKIGGARISLYGIDAPDPDMDRFCTADGDLFGCYANARRGLLILIDEGPFECTPTGKFNFMAFPYMICTVNGVDVAESLIRSGLAYAFLPQTDVYLEAQKAAEAEGVGIWQPGISVMLPWVHREEFNRPVFGP
jgi:succinoglycan biosynthesis protein ExoI